MNAVKIFSLIGFGASCFNIGIIINEVLMGNRNLPIIILLSSVSLAVGGISLCLLDIEGQSIKSLEFPKLPSEEEKK